MSFLSKVVAENRRKKAAFQWKMAHVHPAGSKARAEHLAAHELWVAAAQRADEGDLEAVSTERARPQ